VRSVVNKIQQSRKTLKGFKRWCITLRITGLLDFVHRPVFQETQKNTLFQKLDLFLSPYDGGGRHLLS
jgi:hypothetical protein